jgi:dTDP-4-dehydrorhamnose reductase
MKKILILGHTGMLGRAVHFYFSGNPEFELLTMPAGVRWPSQEFKEELSKADWIINCIGAIPQRTPSKADLFAVNTELPIYLLSLGINTIHAATDCEYSGKIKLGEYYNIEDYEDAYDDYGISKKLVTILAKNSYVPAFNIIRTSIIGLEEKTDFSLLNWAVTQFNNDANISGFTNHYWNGITTLEWAKVAEALVNLDMEEAAFIQPTIKTLSKYELLGLIKEVFTPDSKTLISAVESEKFQNKSLAPNAQVNSIKDQLVELKEWYDLTKV